MGNSDTRIERSVDKYFASTHNKVVKRIVSSPSITSYPLEMSGQQNSFSCACINTLGDHDSCDNMELS